MDPQLLSHHDFCEKCIPKNMSTSKNVGWCWMSKWFVASPAFFLMHLGLLKRLGWKIGLQTYVKHDKTCGASQNLHSISIQHVGYQFWRGRWRSWKSIAITRMSSFSVCSCKDVLWKVHCLGGFRHPTLLHHEEPQCGGMEQVALRHEMKRAKVACAARVFVLEWPRKNLKYAGRWSKASWNL